VFLIRTSSSTYRCKRNYNIVFDRFHFFLVLQRGCFSFAGNFRASHYETTETIPEKGERSFREDSTEFAAIFCSFVMELQKLIIGSRGSQLALVQSEEVKKQLLTVHPTVDSPL
jgi:hypothetical protein